MNNNIPPPPPTWPDGFNVPAPDIQPAPNKNNVGANRPHRNVNNQWANRPIIWNNNPNAAAQAQAHRQRQNRRFKIALIIAGIILLVVILNRISPSRMISGSGSPQYSSEPSRAGNSDPADRLIRAIDKFLGK